MKYTTLLFDNDNTIMDFSAAERQALKKAFLKNGVELSENQVDIYSAINDECWKMFEKGIIDKPTVLRLRFERFLENQKIDLSPLTIGPDYEQALSLEHIVYNGAEQLLQELSDKFDLYMVTNGAAKVQQRRLKESGIDKYFLDVFISEQTGFRKPQKEYFDVVFSRINETDRSKILIIGDSLSSDILGGINAGIDTCLFSPFIKPCGSNEVVPDYVARNYDDIRRIVLECLNL